MKQPECPCAIYSYLGTSDIEYCPLHSAAQEMLDELKYLRNYAHVADLAEETRVRLDTLIAKAEGRQ